MIFLHNILDWLGWLDITGAMPLKVQTCPLRGLSLGEKHYVKMIATCVHISMKTCYSTGICGISFTYKQVHACFRIKCVSVCVFIPTSPFAELGSLTESRNLGVGSVIFALGSLSLNSNQGDSSPERHLEKLEPMEVQNRRLHVRVILDLLQVASILWDSVEFVVLWVHFDFPSLHCVPVYLVYIIYIY